MYIQNNYRPVYLVNIDAKPTTKVLAIHYMTLYHKYDYTVKALHITVKWSSFEGYKDGSAS